MMGFFYIRARGRSESLAIGFNAVKLIYLTLKKIDFIMPRRWVISVNDEQAYLERRVHINKLYDCYKSLLTEKQREVYELHEFSDLSLSEIAEQKGTSRQAVHDILTRTQHKLESFEAKLGLVKGGNKDV